MTKTPEEMAEEYIEDHDECEHAGQAWLAGYKAAMEQVADASKAINFNNGDDAKLEKVNMKFAYDSFPVNDEQVKQIKEIRKAFSVLTEMLDRNVPKGRYLSLVQTKLEEACMFAVKGITHQAGDYDKLQYKA